MKVMFIIIALGIFTTSFAEEVKTDCPAMNQSREKIVKDIKVVKQTKSAVVSQ